MSPGWSPESWAAEWLESMWCGLHAGTGDVGPPGFLSQCGSGEACNGSTEWATPLQIGELVVVQDDKQGEIVDLDMSRDLFTHCVRTLDGATRWYAESKVRRLKAKAVESQRLRSQIAAAGAVLEEESSAPQSPCVSPHRPERGDNARSRCFDRVLTSSSNPASPCRHVLDPVEEEARAEAAVQAAVQELGVENTVSEFIAMPILAATKAVMAASPRISREDTDSGHAAEESAQTAARVEAALGELPLDTQDAIAEDPPCVSWPEAAYVRHVVPEFADLTTLGDLPRENSSAVNGGMIWRLSLEDRFKTTSSDLFDMHFENTGMSLVGLPEPHEVPWLMSPTRDAVRVA